MGCPESHPFAYDYYGDKDYCCAHDPAQTDDYCLADDNEMLGKACEHEPPCDNHPSVVREEVDTAKGLIFKMISLFSFIFLKT